MIGRRFTRKPDEEEIVEPRSFDDFELRLGDMMRGERATLGKSLLDVQRDLRIKASYIAAIENADPTAFDTPGFVAGYVRSYARYLGMDPDEAFVTFCAESGFTVAHGMSAEASGNRRTPRDNGLNAGQGKGLAKGLGKGLNKGLNKGLGKGLNKSLNKGMGKGLNSDPFSGSGTPFLPESEGFFARIEPRAIGSTLVLLAVICGIGYGGWSVLKEVQRVQVTPVEQTPVVLSDLDPLSSAVDGSEEAAQSSEALNRLYRPQALDVPVLVARDAPISTLDPDSMGSFAAPALPDVQFADALDASGGPVAGPVLPQVVEPPKPALMIVAVRPSWMRVKAADGTVIFEGTLGTIEQGNTYEVPLTEEPPTLHAGASGSVYLMVNGEHRGPVGARGSVTRNLALSIEAAQEQFDIADLTQDRDLARVVAELQAVDAEAEGGAASE